ncbi:response regulator transcription factor [Niveispirillum sp. KHB5.9]|uniref:response regulator transcription factor n=1 Tax=Niveispirillum sp. KHB5.9 TaxID=3400269 RepID=UPI003A86E718
MGRKVLIIDDSKLARMLVAGILGRLQPEWSVVEAANAKDALALLAGGGIDITLVDFNMPDMDGLALLTELRRAHPAMPAAIISANAQEGIVSRTHALDAAFIEKPLKDETLRPFLAGADLKLRRARA